MKAGIQSARIKAEASVSVGGAQIDPDRSAQQSLCARQLAERWAEFEPRGERARVNLVPFNAAGQLVGARDGRDRPWPQDDLAASVRCIRRLAEARPAHYL